jgi:hypothetical protein
MLNNVRREGRVARKNNVSGKDNSHNRDAFILQFFVSG